MIVNKKFYYTIKNPDLVKLIVIKSDKIYEKCFSNKYKNLSPENLYLNGEELDRKLEVDSNNLIQSTSNKL